jgi:hypothetical protein
MLHDGAVVLAAQDLVIAHGGDEKAAVRKETEAGGKAGGAGVSFHRAVDRNREHATGVVVSEVEAAVAPARTLGEGQAVKKSGKRGHDERCESRRS